MEYVYKKVSSIIFGMLSPDFIRKFAASKIVTPELYDREGYPVDGGLMDTHLGIIDPGLRCKTCAGKLKECPGHFGYIDLARPIIHIKYIPMILDCLRSTCGVCSRILLNDADIIKYKEILTKIEVERGVEAKRKKSKELISILKNIKKCPHCNEKKYIIKVEKPTTFLERDKRLSPIEIKLKLGNISDSDLYILGFNPQYARPDWAVLVIFPIPPVTIRPSITLESGERSEDDLTHKLGDIVRINQRLFENINAGAPEIIIEDLWDLLQYHVTTYFDNSTAQVPPARHRSGQVLKTLTERIKSKEGRFRHNLAGKRVNFAARTVVSPDTEIKFNDVGIPKIVAMELTIPETVTDWNKNYLKNLVEKGPSVYPGANYVMRPDGKKKKITDETKQQLLDELSNGFVVERHLIDGDIAIFNRQPSLHRMSVMCHKIKVLPGKSFRLNPSVCVAPNTNVLLDSGIQRPIDELKNCWKESSLSTFDVNKNQIKSTELTKFWSLKPEAYNTKCYKIITKETGRKVIATTDHPFYTKEGVKITRALKINDKLVVQPIDAPSYKDIDKEIITEKEIIKVSPENTYLKHTLKTLKDLMLVPLNLRDQRSMILARLLGHIFGDGTLILKKDSGRLIFRGNKKDLIKMQDDIKKLGFNPEKIYIKTHTGIITTIAGKKLIVKGSGHDFEVRHKPLAILFASLGAPIGDKIPQNFHIPNWIMNSPDYIRREFLASYFGCELSKLALRKDTDKRFRPLVFKQSKINKNHNNFVMDAIKLLSSFKIQTCSITIEPENIRKDNSKSFAFVIKIRDTSLLNFLGKIGYIYHEEKENLARQAYQYLTIKQKEINLCNKKYRLFKKFRKEGVKFKEISKKLNVSVGVLENWAYNYNKASLPLSFQDFESWKMENAVENTGLVYETVKSIQETYAPYVCDVTTLENTHNFFANGFLTGNCEPYNADFDGDEMNLHIPQSEEARAEADILMQVQTQIISPKHGKNIISCVEDSVSGIYLLTKDMELSKETATQILVSIGVEEFEFKKSNVNGKELFSVLLPKDYNYIGYAKKYTRCEKCSDSSKHNCEFDTYIVIKNGQLLSGIIDSNSIGTENGSLIIDLVKKYGEDITIEIIGKIFKLGIKVLLNRGFTTSIQDTDLNQDIKDKIDISLKEAEQKIHEYIDLYKKSKLEALPGKSIEDTLEIRALEILNKVRNKIGGVITDSAIQGNSTIIMALSGAKGNLLNLAQMAACVGQQSLSGKRIDKGYLNRTLSMFKTGDLGPEARGFIRSGFKSGLSPFEFFFHAMTGRDALMDTALRTPKSGYLYRRLSNALQDIKIEYDGTVRDANKSIVQFKYGEDNVDVSRSNSGNINVKDIIKEVLGE